MHRRSNVGFMGGVYRVLWGSIGFRVSGGVVINGVTSRVTIPVTHIRGLITPLITTHEHPSSVVEGEVGKPIDKPPGARR